MKKYLATAIFIYAFISIHKEVEVLGVSMVTATTKVTAWSEIDYLQLRKQDGDRKIETGHIGSPIQKIEA